MNTKVTIMPPVGGDDPAHVAAMIAKAEGKPAPAAVVPPEERPDWFPVGINTKEELLAAFTESTKPKEEAPAGVTPDPVKAAAEAAAKTAADEAAAKAVGDAGLDMDALEVKITSGAGLDADDYAKLAKVGIKKEMADSYIAGQIALGEQFSNRIYSTVGGQEAYEAIAQWAAGGGATAAEVAAFNKAVDTGDEASVKMALAGLDAKYRASGNVPPTLLTGERGAIIGDVYESAQQMMKDMRDPQYSRDPAFRAKVEAKLARSSIL